MCDSLCWRRGKNGQKYRDILYGQNWIHQFLVETREVYTGVAISIAAIC